jgi:hypothetical protein
MLAHAAASFPFVWILTALTLVPACASAGKTEASAATSSNVAGAGGDSGRQLAASRDKLTLARMQAEIAAKKAEDARSRKEREVELAHAEIAQFDELDAPNRVAKAHLDLVRRQDALAEQQEELAQLEMMYEKEDLADKTREIVLQRGKRRVERAKEELAIAERETQSLETRTIPRERAKLQLEADAKSRELSAMKLETEANLLEKATAVKAAEADLQAAEAKAGAKP